MPRKPPTMPERVRKALGKGPLDYMDLVRAMRPMNPDALSYLLDVMVDNGQIEFKGGEYLLVEQPQVSE